MHPRLYRLIEMLQRIDDRLRRAEARADRPEATRLRFLKLKARQLIHRLAARPALAGGGI